MISLIMWPICMMDVSLMGGYTYNSELLGMQPQSILCVKYQDQYTCYSDRPLCHAKQ